MIKEKPTLVKGNKTNISRVLLKDKSGNKIVYTFYNDLQRELFHEGSIIFDPDMKFIYIDYNEN
jgi:hypothetical protein